MVKKEQDSNGKSDRIGDFQDGKTIGDFSCHLKINLLKQAANIDISIESHDGKCSSEKGGKADKKDFEPAKKCI